jgi:hypothetical protein
MQPEWPLMGSFPGNVSYRIGPQLCGYKREGTLAIQENTQYLCSILLHEIVERL